MSDIELIDKYSRIIETDDELARLVRLLAKCTFDVGKKHGWVVGFEDCYMTMKK